MTHNYLDILSETIRNNWDQPALTDFYLTEDGKSQDTSCGDHYTYGEMYEEIVRVANLLNNLGLQKGDHIAICGVNSAHWAIAYLAVAKMQGVSVTIMPSLASEQITQMLISSDSKALFTDSDLWEELKEQSLPQVRNVIVLEDWLIMRGEKIKNQESSIKSQDCCFPLSEPDSLAMICYTSGSTGLSKGVMLSYKNISMSLYDMSNFYSSNENDRNGSYFSKFPFAHIGGLVGELLDYIVFGKHAYINRNVMTIATLMRSLMIIQPKMIIFVPMLVRGLFNDANTEFVNLLKENCKAIAITMAKWDKDIENCIIATNIPLYTSYGQTEAAAISVTPYNAFRSSSSGLVCKGMIIDIAPNGEILVKGDNVMLGYYKDPEATAAKIDKDGWLHTGDKGHLDEDGYLYVEGRLEQDIIVLPNGENIRPDNIESLINALPEVSESIVLARDGKLVARVVVPSSLPFREESEVGSLRRMILRQVNPQLPLFSQLYDVEITDQPLARTEKQTLKRYLYK